MDLQQQLDTSFGEGPAHQPLEATLRAGRGALRRRRLATAAGTLSVIAVLGLAATLTLGHADDRSSRPTYTATEQPVDDYLDEVPVSPTLGPECGTDSPQQEAAATCEPPLIGYDNGGQLLRAPGVVVDRLVVDPVLRGEAEKSAALEVELDGRRWWVFTSWMPGGSSDSAEPAGDDFDAWVARGVRREFGGISSGTPPRGIGDLTWWDARTGELTIPDGVTVLRRVENPLDYQPPFDSVGLVAEWRGTVYWVLTDQTLTNGSGGSSVASDEAEDAAYADFDAWLADQVALQQGNEPQRFVVLAADGSLTPAPGVTILEQRANPDLPDDFAPPGAPTAAAEVRLDGAIWFVLARRLPGEQPDYIGTRGDVAGDTLDEFLAYARTRYLGGEGLR